jgi:hypothetical protein
MLPALATPAIFLIGNRLKVSGIDAGPVAAQVIELQAIRNGPDE